MTPDIIQRYKELFIRKDIRGFYSKFVCFLLSLIAICEYEKSPGEYGSYTEALKNAKKLTAYCNQIPNGFDPEALELMAQIEICSSLPFPYLLWHSLQFDRCSFVSSYH